MVFPPRIAEVKLTLQGGRSIPRMGRARGDLGLTELPRYQARTPFPAECIPIISAVCHSSEG
jgi:hypothetical protein